MAWFLNDLSLTGQYPTPEFFIEDLKQLLALRCRSPLLTSRLFCSRTICTQPVSPNHNFQQAVRGSADKTLTSLVLNWITKAGPFWEDQRQQVADDYFHYQKTEVTELGLGEASRRLLGGETLANSVSFAAAGFDYSPLQVVQGLLEEPISTISVTNLWKWGDIQQAAEAAAPPIVNWEQMLTAARRRFEHLNLVANCSDSLKSEPFSYYAVERIFELLRVLNEYMFCMIETGAPTKRNNELMAQHFTGAKSWFSDESESNKRNFKKELEFSDPTQPGKKFFCSWHGKIKTPQYRIHFEWPPMPRTKLSVFYIGPKITKS
ncbi:hypothetical protein [Jeongeupia chitinilytica]|uniref:hypothetical protein n=1 Tax=Jeongeupia chitinilytica TaxID=1041641 RepID=UPI001671F962|nr:hypothetical protein [Jeongeupia chitinilytica]